MVRHRIRARGDTGNRASAAVGPDPGSLISAKDSEVCGGHDASGSGYQKAEENITFHDGAISLNIAQLAERNKVGEGVCGTANLVVCEFGG